MDWIPDLRGKVIIVTGANNGLGFEAAKVFASHEAQVVLACRDLVKGKAARDQVRSESIGAKVEVIHLDLANLASIHQFAQDFKAKYERLDVLVNNAGILAVPYAKTVDGFESQFGTNYLGHFALTGLLIDHLLKTNRSRVVMVSSTSHRLGKIDFDNLNYEDGNGYTRMGAYRRSKLANLIFAYELDRRLKGLKADTVSVAAHPGISNTNIVHHFDHLKVTKILRFFFDWLIPIPAVGVLPILRAAVDEEVEGGEYFGPGGYFWNQDRPKLVKSTKGSRDVVVAKRLWEVSEELTGVAYL